MTLHDKPEMIQLRSDVSKNVTLIIICVRYYISKKFCVKILNVFEQIL